MKEEREDDVVVSQGGVASIARWVSESLRILRYVRMDAPRREVMSVELTLIYQGETFPAIRCGFLLLMSGVVLVLFYLVSLIADSHDDTLTILLAVLYSWVLIMGECCGCTCTNVGSTSTQINQSI